MSNIDYLIDDLVELDDEKFRKLVDQDVRRRDGEGDLELAQALRSPALVRRYYTMLVRTLKSVEGQLAARETDYEARRARLKAKLSIAQSQLKSATTDEDRNKAQSKVVNLTAEIETEKSKHLLDRGKTLRYKTGLDMALVEIRSILDGLHDDMYDTIVARERNHYAERCRQLEDAIRQHQTEVLADDEDEPFEADMKLWSSLQRGDEAA